MKKLFLSAILLLSSHLHAAAEVTPQDIVTKLRLDRDSSVLLIDRIRTALANNQIGDPYNQTFKTPIKVDLNQALADLPPDSQTWIKDFQSVVNLRLFDSSYKLKIDNFSYRINHFSSELLPSPEGNGRIEYVTKNSVKGLKLSAEKISFVVILERTQSGDPISFSIELIGPEFIIDQDLIFELPMLWSSTFLPNSLMVSLNSIDLSQVFAKIVENPKLVNLQVKDLKMPNVSFSVGHREVKLDREKIKKFIITRSEDMKMAIIDVLRSRMNEWFSNVISDKPQEVILPTHYSVAASVSPVFELKSIEANKETKIMEVMVDGHFCSNPNELSLNYCEASQLTAKLRRKITAEDFVQSMKDIDLLFSEKRANVAVSVSEHYVNQVIEAAASIGLLDLAGGDFALGPEKAFILAEEKGESFNLYLDVIYTLTRSERLMVGRSELRFPVNLSIGIKMIDVDGFPRFQIKVLKNRTTKSLLLKGLPKYDLRSTVSSARFQDKVLKRITERMKPFNEKVLIDIELQEFKGTYLEQLNFLSDGRGRATAVLFMNR